jgi:hypothetical protein
MAKQHLPKFKLERHDPTRTLEAKKKALARKAMKDTATA